MNARKRGCGRDARDPKKAKEEAMNAYTTVETLKSAAVLDIRGAESDGRLRALAEAASRQVDWWCNRHFYEMSAARVFDSDGSPILRTPDLISVDANGLRTDEDGDREFETTWAAADFLLHPASADPTGGHDYSRPYTALLADGAKRFPRGRRSVEIRGRWGYVRRLRKAAETTAARISADDSEIRLSERADVEIGHTILIGAERLYAVGADGDTLRVVRAVNGSEAASHAEGAEIRVCEYPSPVSEAAIIETARLWRRGARAEPAPSGEMDADARRLLAGYRKMVTGMVTGAA